MKSIINGKLFYKGKIQPDLVLIFDQNIHSIMSSDYYKTYKKEKSIDDEIDAKGLYVVPGFIDVHIHGYKGFDTMEGNLEGLQKMSRDLCENGITAFLPTTMTMPMPAIINALSTIEEAMDSPDENGAMIVGAHLEGPFINEKKKGAQSADHIRLPEKELLDQFEKMIKVVTIAPEVEGAKELITAYKDKVNFSIGHTNATYAQTKEAYNSGAKGTTHLFNAMTGLNHREPGVVGAAFTCDCYAELIADNYHVNPGIFPLIIREIGINRLLLITDCIQAGGLEDGTYDLGGQEVTVKDQHCNLTNGTIAGSVLKLNEGLKNVAQVLEKEFEVTLPLVTINQATYLGLQGSMGTLDIGKYANIVIIDKEYKINKTMVKGELIYENNLQ